MQTKFIKFLKVFIPIIIGLYLMWYFWDSMSEKNKISFFKSIENVNYFWILISMGLGLFSHISRAIRWKYMLEPIGYKTKLKNRYNSLMIGYIMNLLIPRAGEVSRAGALYKSENVPFAKSFGTIIAERVFDLIMLGLIFLITLMLGYNDLTAITNKNNLFTPNNNNVNDFSFTKILIIIALILFFIFILFLPKIKNKILKLFKDVWTGMFSVFKSKNPWKFLFHTFFIWFSYIAFFGICFFSLEQTSNIPISGILIGFIAGTIGIMLTNGGMGAYPMLVGIVTSYYLEGTLGEEEAKGVGNALGMMIWASQTIMMILLGLISILMIQKSKQNTLS